MTLEICSSILTNKITPSANKKLRKDWTLIVCSIQLRFDKSPQSFQRIKVCDYNIDYQFHLQPIVLSLCVSEFPENVQKPDANLGHNNVGVSEFQKFTYKVSIIDGQSLYRPNSNKVYEHSDYIIGRKVYILW